MSHALSVSELCDTPLTVVTNTNAVHEKTDGRSQTATERDTSVPCLEEQLRLAKEHGLYMHLNDENKASEKHRRLVLQFLADFSELRPVSVRPSSAEVLASATPKASAVGHASPSGSGASEEDEDEYEDESEAESPAAIETTRLKRKGFPFNPVCLYCELQFDEDDNPEGCCKTHTGSLSGDFGHEYFADDDYPEQAVYDGTAPDAWEWSCCEGDGDAPPCRSGKHEERYGTRPRYA